MNPKIKIALIGGTGKSGTYLLKALLQQGFQIKMLIRNPEHAPAADPLIEIVNGDVTAPLAIATLVRDCQAVMSTLGLGIPASEPTIFSQAANNIIQSMNKYGLSRYIVTTGLNVDTPADRKSAETAAATAWMKEHYPASTTDKQKEYEILAASSIEWTLVRLPRIELTEESGPIALSLEDCPGQKIRASDLAAFLVAQLSDQTFIRQAPFIASTGV